MKQMLTKFRNANMYKWLLAVIISITIAMSGALYNGAMKSIDNLGEKVEKKVDKEQYYKDIDEIKQMLKELYYMQLENNKRKR